MAHGTLRVPGKRLVYLSEHPALALLETLVNMRGKPNQTHPSSNLLKVTALEAILTRELDRVAPGRNWKLGQAHA